MPPKGTKASKKQATTGALNLKKFTDEHGHTAATTHGAHSQTIRKRYSDLRTSEGKRLHEAIKIITDDLGGPSALNAAQQVILSALRSKLITLFQIGSYIDKRQDVIDATGELIPCMRNSFLPYTASIRKDLELLYSFSARGGKRNVPTLKELIDGHNTGDKE